MFKEIRQGLTENEQYWRKAAEGRRSFAELGRFGRPATAMESFTQALKIELSVLGHQILLVLMIAVANIVFFGLLILALPYIFRWFFSFP